MRFAIYSSKVCIDSARMYQPGFAVYITLGVAQSNFPTHYKYEIRSPKSSVKVIYVPALRRLGTSVPVLRYRKEFGWSKSISKY
jgi:hypothetical protein